MPISKAVVTGLAVTLCSSWVHAAASASPSDSDENDDVPAVRVVNDRPSARRPPSSAKPVAFDPTWLQPFFAGPALHNAAIDFRQEQWAAAESGFVKAAARLPPSSDERYAARFMAALAKANQGKWSDAAAAFEALYRQYSRLAPYHAYNAARCHLRAGQAQVALDWAAKVAPGTVPEAEAELVHLDALRALSRWSDVAAAAAEYLARFPSGPRRAEATFKQADAREKVAAEARAASAGARASASASANAGAGAGAGGGTGANTGTRADAGAGVGAEAGAGAEAKAGAEAELADITALYRRVWAEAPLEEWAARAADRLEAIAATLSPSSGKLVRTHIAAEWFARGMVYFDRNRNVDSEAAFTSALGAPALDVDLECQVRYHRAQSVWKQRQRPRAAPLFDEAEAACARAGNRDLHAKSLYQGARTWAAAGDRPAAQLRYARIEAEHPEHSYADDARVRTAELATDSGDDEAADKLLADVPEKYPRGDLLTEALWRLAFSAWRAERYDVALRWLDENLKRIPHEEIWYAEGRALYWKARVLERRKEPAAARTFYMRAIREYPLSFYALLAFARLGDRDPKARATLMRELRDTAKPASFHFAPRPLFGEPGFRRAVDLARMGQGGDARRELARMGLQTSGDKHGGGGGTGKRDEEDLQWIATILLDRGGVWSAAHSIPRYTLTDYRLSYPRGLGAVKWRLSYPRAFPELVAKNARANQIPEGLQLAIMREESAFSPRIESFANAIGLTQMLIKTASRFSNGARVTRETLMDPVKNLEYGSRFLGFLWIHFAKAAPLSIAGYNAGEAAVDRWLSERGKLAMDEFLETIPYDETRNYTKRVLASYFAYSWLYDGKRPVPAIPLAARSK